MEKRSMNNFKIISFVAMISFILMVMPYTARAATSTYINKAYIPADTGYDGVLDVVDLDTGSIQQAKIQVGRNPQSATPSPDRTRVFVTNLDDGTVSVIDPYTDTVIETITVGSYPLGVAFNSDGTKAYVVNNMSNSVSVIDTATLTVMQTISGLGTNPCGAVVVGNTLYVTVRIAGTVTMIDTDTDSIAGAITVGSEPYGIVANPDGTKLYVANTADNTVSVIDVSTNAVVSVSVGASSSPLNLAVSPDGGVVYVAQAGWNNYTVINTADNTTQQNYLGGRSYSVDVSGNGKQVCFLDYGSNNLRILNTEIGSVTTIATSYSPTAIGPFIVCNATTYSVTFDKNGGTTEASPRTINVTEPDTTVNDLPEQPTKSGAVFLSWWTGNGVNGDGIGADGGDGWGTRFTKNTVVDGSITVFARWGSGISGKAYIPSFNTGGLDVIDLHTNSVLTTIDLGSDTYPVSAVVNPNETQVFVCKAGDDTVAVIDPLLDTVVKTIPVGSGPEVTAFNETGTKAYVTLANDNSIAVIDTSALTVDTVITGLNTPVGALVSGNFLYVSEASGDTAAKINTMDNTIVGGVSVGMQPFGLSINPEGTMIYTANRDSNDVSVIRVSDFTVTATVAVGTSPYYAGVTPDGGKIYVINRDSSNVTVINAPDNTVLRTIDVGDYPSSVDFIGGYAVVVNYGSGSISFIDISTDKVIFEIPTSEGPMILGSHFLLPPSYPPVNGTDATLTDLAASGIVLTPAFDSGTKSYHASVGNGISSTTISAPASDPSATVTINGTVGSSAAINLNVGLNEIVILVLAEDGITTDTYTISITREAGPVDQYTLTFDGNGGGAPDPISKPVTFDAAYGTLATVSRTGYAFAGWFTAPSGGTEVTAATIVATATDHTLYAHWAAYGDVDGDGVVSDIDRTTLARYLAGWPGYTISASAADANADGKVSDVDRTILARHLAGWIGYETLPHLIT